MALTTVCVKFPDDDHDLLLAICEKERLTRSDIIRRAIRAYADQLGVKAPKKPKR